MSIVLNGTDAIVGGYNSLERAEVNFAKHAIDRHGDVLETWFRVLTLYCQAIERGFNYRGALQPDEKWQAWALQQELLGLGVSQSKAALDALLVGYYSVAFGAIRHLLESRMQFVYLATFPEEYPLWYGNPGQQASDEMALKPNKKHGPFGPPLASKMRSDLIALSPAQQSFFESMYGVWKAMCPGAHPSGEGLMQVDGGTPGRHVFTATYKKNHFMTGFEYGVSATIYLLDLLEDFEPQPAEWSRELDAAYGRLQAWRKAALATAQF